MIILKDILLEINVTTLTPTNYKLNKLITKEVWHTFLKEMNRLYKFGHYFKSNPKRKTVARPPKLRK